MAIVENYTENGQWPAVFFTAERGWREAKQWSTLQTGHKTLSAVVLFTGSPLLTVTQARGTWELHKADWFACSTEPHNKKPLKMRLSCLTTTQRNWLSRNGYLLTTSVVRQWRRTYLCSYVGLIALHTLASSAEWLELFRSLIWLSSNRAMHLHNRGEIMRTFQVGL